MVPSQETIDNRISLCRVLSYLNENEVRYKVCHFSPFHTQEEVRHEGARLGLGLIEAVPLALSGQGIILAIIPSSRALHLAELAKLVAPRQIRTMAPLEACERLSLPPAEGPLPPLAALLGVDCLLSPLIEQHHTVGFFVDSAHALITLEARDFRRLVQKTFAIPVPTRAKYRAYASPRRKAHQHAILGVSLENADFRTSKLITITDWIRNHYASCVVMLGDGMNRITLQLDDYLPESEALERSKWLARNFVYSQSSVFRGQDSKCQFDFVFSSDIQKTIGYRTYYAQLAALFEHDGTFQESFKAFSHEFLRRKAERQEHGAGQVEMSCQYLLEELAVISCLAEHTPCTFVYPGSLTILEEIAEGKHPDVPVWLRQIDYVELKLKGR